MGKYLRLEANVLSRYKYPNFDEYKGDESSFLILTITSFSIELRYYKILFSLKLMFYLFLLLPTIDHRIESRPVFLTSEGKPIH